MVGFQESNSLFPLGGIACLRPFVGHGSLTVWKLSFVLSVYNLLASMLSLGVLLLNWPGGYTGRSCLWLGSIGQSAEATACLGVNELWYMLHDVIPRVMAIITSVLMLTVTVSCLKSMISSSDTFFIYLNCLTTFGVTCLLTLFIIVHMLSKERILREKYMMESEISPVREFFTFTSFLTFLITLPSFFSVYVFWSLAKRRERQNAFPHDDFTPAFINSNKYQGLNVDV